MATTTERNPLPSGGAMFTSIPDLFFIPEWVCGGLVWMLVASTKILVTNPQAWVMFVSLFCFIMTTLLFFIYMVGGNKSRVFPTLDVALHALAAFFYLSASVAQAYTTIGIGSSAKALSYSSLGFNTTGITKIYHLDIAAVVMSFVATLLYTVHTIFSAVRWKSS